MTEKHYIHNTRNLMRALERYLRRMRGPLVREYGPEKTDTIITRAPDHYQGIIPKIPYYSTPAYDSLVLLCSRMMALKKAMRDEGLGVENFASLIISSIRTRADRVPLFIRRFGGRLFLSRPVRWYMKRVGRKATENGWPTEVTDGDKGDAFDMRIRTTGCGMLRFVDSIGEGDLREYCSLFDFAMAEATGIGLKQVSTLDSGECVYAVSRNGIAKWPEALARAMKKQNGKN